MRTIIQRVLRAQATPKGDQKEDEKKIGAGLLILCGFEDADSPVILDMMAQKIRALRIFSDELGKMNRAGSDVSAQYLLVSQFTLFADCKYGNRPSFEKAAGKAKAKELYEYFVQIFARVASPAGVCHSAFGSDLEVALSNDGPVTLFLDSKDLT